MFSLLMDEEQEVHVCLPSISAQFDNICLKLFGSYKTKSTVV